MSDQSRDETTGQFSSAAPLYGQARIEHDAGYVPYKDENAAVEDNSEVTIHEAAKALTESRTSEANVKTYSAIDSLPDNVTLTIEQAAQSLEDERAADEAQAELERADKIRGEVDKLREDSGVKTEVKSEAPEIGKDPEADVERFLKLPHVKEAVDKWNTEAETARQTYSQATDIANDFARTSFIENFPEIAALPLQQWEGALAVMAQQEPERFGKAVNSLQRVVQLQTAQQQQQQQRAEAERTRLKGESQRFEEKIKDVPKERRVEVENEIVAAIKEHGSNMEEVVKFLRSSEASSATVMELLWELGDARSQLKAIKSAKAAVATRTLPPVQRPGTSNVARSSEPSSKIAALERQLSSATGDKAARISAEIWGLQKRARG